MWLKFRRHLDRTTRCRLHRHSYHGAGKYSIYYCTSSRYGSIKPHDLGAYRRVLSASRYVDGYKLLCVDAYNHLTYRGNHSTLCSIVQELHDSRCHCIFPYKRVPATTGSKPLRCLIRLLSTLVVEIRVSRVRCLHSSYSLDKTSADLCWMRGLWYRVSLLLLRCVTAHILMSDGQLFPWG